ncbi:MAG TPA: hypothetical protein VJA94_06955 [Candidatus Angelobacter sp.]
MSAAAATSVELATTENPFPGLRSFDLEESHLFFGRDGQSEQLISKLAQWHFVAVIGTSGSGKSSLVRAGLLPVLLGGFIVNAHSAWKIATMRPGNDPLGNLARALHTRGAFGIPGDVNSDFHAVVTEATLRRGSRGLLDALRHLSTLPNENLLLVVDQFEEIFRFRKVVRNKEYENDAAAFVKIILEAARQREMPIYVVLTMRSDYLGECSQFQGLPEAMNDSQYLIPRLARDQFRDAITGPVAVGGGAITPRLVNRLLNDIGDDQDQLPILQHAMMRTWEKWKCTGKTTPIDIADYEAAGGMAEALSRHAEEAWSALPDTHSRELVEKLFKALTEKDRDDRDIRRPITLAYACNVTGCTEDELKSVIEIFRQHGRSFLMPAAGIAIESLSMIDISHESLIRCWARLHNWVKEEAESGDTYRRVSDAARLFYEGKGGLWRDPQLHLALDWRRKTKPNVAWAKRYGFSFPVAMEFLDHSEYLRQKQLRLQRFFYVLFGVLLLTATSYAVWRLSPHSGAQPAENHRSEILALAIDRWQISKSPEANLNLALDFPYPLAVLERHTHSVLHAAFSPDGQRLATASEDASVCIWNTSDFRLLHTLKGHSQRVWYVSFSPDGKRIVTASDDDTARVWDASTGQQEGKLTGHTEKVSQAVFSPDGKWILTASNDKTARLWNAQDYKEQFKFEGPDKSDSKMAAAEFSPNGQQVVMANGGKTAGIWSTTSGQLITALRGHDGPIVQAAFSPDGKLVVTASEDKTARVWSAVDGRSLAVLPSQDIVAYANFSPDGRSIITTSWDHTVRVWDVNSHDLKMRLDATTEIWHTAFSPDSRWILTAGKDHDATIWSAADGRMLAILRGHKNSIVQAEFSPDAQRIVTSSWDTTARLWNMGNSQLLQTLQVHTGEVLQAQFSPDGQKIVTASSDNTAEVWNEATGELKATLQGHTGKIRSAIFSRDAGRILTASDDKTARIWNAENGQLLRTLQDSTGAVINAAFSNDGQRILIASSDNSVRIWNAANGHPLAALPLQTEPLVNAIFSPDGERLLTSSTDNTARLWNAANGTLLATLQDHIGKILAASFSPDGQRIVTIDATKTVRVWNAANGQLLAVPPGDMEKILAASFSPDGQRVVTTGADNTARVWNVAHGELLAALEAHTDHVIAAAFSPDGQRIVTASADKTAKVFHLITLSDIADLLKK